jgi:hypothetical protein
MDEPEPKGLPHGLLTADELVDRCAAARINVSVSDVVELADAGFLPAWRWKNQPRWYFQLTECRAWFRDNWLTRQDGRPAFHVRVIVENNLTPAVAALLPRSLHLIADKLRTMEAVPGMPGAPGVYFLLHRDEVVYVGQSTNVFGRVAAHTGDISKAFDGAAYLPLPVSVLDSVEGALIRLLRPRLNGNPGPVAGLYAQDVLDALNIRIRTEPGEQPPTDAATSLTVIDENAEQ